ncbi:uncharacterized protein EV422DRAFT_597297 [Fimicolochytrium jonesii]|uniref:uncharacterized protein n=1 Tax=Fimicolochytrium jonesii TaxID=1396493 RepID=UPI0022FF1922|nr:uncharacterized protein EV422DRAFT_597297 [Fimicolochytrium jonesii]KAI8820247.1 hypothetical protein EV422DRAFT_597297 [Fimicolochytrium jonesii]
MPSHRGLKVHVQVDNQNLKEYKTTVSDDGKLSLYLCTASLDGVPSTKSVIAPPGWKEKGVRSGTKLYPFRFGKLDPEAAEENDGPPPQLNSKLQELSTIKVEITRVADRQINVRSTEPMAPPDLSAGNISKKKDAFLSHRSVLGEAEEIPPIFTCQAEYMDNKQPVVTFIFKYRSRSLLEADDIIPYIPTEAGAAEFNPATPQPPRIPRRRLLLPQRSTTPIKIDSDEDITIDLTAETDSFTVTRRKREAGSSSSSSVVVKRAKTGEGGVIDLVKQEGEGAREKEEMRVLREQVRSLQERLGRQGEASGSGSGSGSVDGPAGPAAQSSSTA